MRLRIIVGATLQAIGIGFAVFFSNPVIALVLIYAGFLVLFHHKLIQLFKAGRNHTEQHISTSMAMSIEESSVNVAFQTVLVDENGWKVHLEKTMANMRGEMQNVFL